MVGRGDCGRIRTNELSPGAVVGYIQPHAVRCIHFVGYDAGHGIRMHTTKFSITMHK